MVAIEVPERFEKQVRKQLAKLEAEEKKIERALIYRNRGIDFWNERLDYINEQIGGTSEGYFKWDVLVMQEIMMYASIAKPVDQRGDFEWLCNRRGFNDAQRKFLSDAIDYMGMGWQEGDSPKDSEGDEPTPEPDDYEEKMPYTKTVGKGVKDK